MDPNTATKMLSRIVLVVGIDLGEESSHLLELARDLARGVAETELHVVHVVAPESFAEVLLQPVGSPGIAERTRGHIAAWEIEQLCRSTEVVAGACVVVHTPAGRPVEQLVRIAREVAADAIVVQAHDHAGARPFHRSTVATLARKAPCSVVTIRVPPRLKAESGIRFTAAHP
jgi:nucleotide-binding universal stress UspA family protein